MADSSTLSFRPIFIEDFGVSSTLGQTTTTILGLGPNIAVTPIVTAISDSNATAIGLSQGDVYLYTGQQPYRFRSCGPFGGGGGGGGGVTKLSGSITITVDPIDDGVVASLSTTIAIAGIFVGDAVSLATLPALPTGVQAIGKVVTSGNVTIEIWNLSGTTITPGQTTFNASIFH